MFDCKIKPLLKISASTVGNRPTKAVRNTPRPREANIQKIRSIVALSDLEDEKRALAFCIIFLKPEMGIPTKTTSGKSTCQFTVKSLKNLKFT